ncbi:hypothetical protein [Limnoraphis robusta]|uniref:Uncharacterized protein n=1 Tax=Limnoraphis robusta CCNP1315 TaxID=3110306 RepID=A0ABU5U6M6_9CYAN|nr:hypothetical protein [Limnoraphis robusta]MEA5522531.1 hypothetical protein [Limnoraphis robusta CCNP1315]MEA5548274.1 hypothetical protein [Limnoraphis robusta CCNP1324]
MPNILETLQDESRFDKIKKSINKVNQGVENLSDIAENLADQTVDAVESGMRLGYAYAQVEAEEKQSVNSDEYIDVEVASLSPNTSQVLEQEYLKNADYWTKDSLKARFGSCQKAYQYLQKTYGFKFQPSWDKVLEAFNTGGKKESLTLEQEVETLKQTVSLQQQQLHKLEQQNTLLEAKLNEVLRLLNSAS